MLSIDQFDYVDGSVKESSDTVSRLSGREISIVFVCHGIQKGAWGMTSYIPLFVISVLDPSSSSKLGNILTIFRISEGWIHVWSDRTYSKITIV